MLAIRTDASYNIVLHNFVLTDSSKKQTDSTSPTEPLKPSVQSTPTRTNVSHLDTFAATATIMYKTMIVNDPEVLTFEDAYASEHGMPFAQYDALVVYAEDTCDDIDFAMDVLAVLEHRRGLKICRLDQMVGGNPFDCDRRRDRLMQRCNRLVLLMSDTFVRTPLMNKIERYALTMDREQRSRKIVPMVRQRLDELPCVFRGLYVLQQQRATDMATYWRRLYYAVITPSGAAELAAGERNERRLRMLDAQDEPNLYESVFVRELEGEEVPAPPMVSLAAAAAKVLAIEGNEMRRVSTASDTSDAESHDTSGRQSDSSGVDLTFMPHTASTPFDVFARSLDNLDESDALAIETDYRRSGMNTTYTKMSKRSEVISSETFVVEALDHGTSEYHSYCNIGFGANSADIVRTADNTIDSGVLRTESSGPGSSSSSGNGSSNGSSQNDGTAAVTALMESLSKSSKKDKIKGEKKRNSINRFLSMVRRRLFLRA